MKRVLTVLLLLVMAVAAMGQEPVRKYEVKSGIFKTKMTVMGQSVETTTYFDEYGEVFDRFTEKFAPLQDGKASKRAVECLLQTGSEENES